MLESYLGLQVRYAGHLQLWVVRAVGPLARLSGRRKTGSSSGSSGVDLAGPLGGLGRRAAHIGGLPYRQIQLQGLGLP